MSHPVTSALKQFLKHHKIGQCRLLVGVSGGADSVALLRGLIVVKDEFQLDLIAAHFDHGLRAGSAADAEWVLRFCEEQGVDCLSGTPQESTGDVDNAERVSEETARRWRYDFLKQVAEDQHCRWLTVAHHADDQAETVLHHLIRGSGLKGISGIPAVRQLSEAVTLVRPLLNCSRVEILDFLKQIGQSYRVDQTNQQSDYTRNRIRNQLIPQLQSEFNPGFTSAVIRLSQQARDAQESLEFVAATVLESVLEQQLNVVRLTREPLKTLPKGLLREVYRLLWERQQWPRQELTFEHLEQLAWMTSHGKPAGRTLPGGIEVQVRSKFVKISRAEPV